MYTDKKVVTIDSIQPDLKSISIAIDHVIVDAQGNVVSNINRLRCGFEANAWQQVADFLSANAPDTNLDNVNNLLAVIWGNNNG